MDPVKMKCQSITKTKGKTHEVVQFYSTAANALLGTPSMQITSDAGEETFGKFVPGREYAFIVEDLSELKGETPPAPVDEEETITITEADVAPAKSAPTPSSSSSTG